MTDDADPKATRSELDPDLYDAEIDVNDDNEPIADDDDFADDNTLAQRVASAYEQQREAFAEAANADDEDANPFAETMRKTIHERESAYHARRLQRIISPERRDEFAENAKAVDGRGFADIMKETDDLRDEADAVAAEAVAQAKKQRRRRWDDDGDASVQGSTVQRRSRWDATPQHEDMEDAGSTSSNVSAWDETPRHIGSGDIGATPTPSRRSRWDQTPKAFDGQTPAQTPLMMGEAADIFLG